MAKVDKFRLIGIATKVKKAVGILAYALRNDASPEKLDEYLTELVELVELLKYFDQEPKPTLCIEFNNEDNF